MIIRAIVRAVFWTASATLLLLLCSIESINL